MNEIPLHAQIDLTKSGLIEASAGSGKTYTIERLFCRLLIEPRGEHEPWAAEQIAVITYTEKAAGELRRRLREQLREKIADPAMPVAERQLLQNAARNFHLTAIGTIHGFCRQILNRYPFLTNSGGELELVDNRAGIKNLTERRVRDLWANPRWENSAKIQRLFASAETGILSPAPLIEKITALAEKYNSQTTRIISKSGDPVSQFVADEAQAVAAAWQLRKKNAGQQAYDDMLGDLLIALNNSDNRDNCELARQLRGDFRCGIIDEFQDANNLVWQIAERIFLPAKVAPADRETPENTLYLVGDPKQSIYAFQGANIQTYEIAKRQCMARGKIYALTKNYRSAPALVAATNALFSAQFAPVEKKTKTAKTASFPRSWFASSGLEFLPAASGMPENYAARLNGAPAPPVWLSEENLDEREVENWLIASLQKMLARNARGETALQIPGKDAPEKFRNLEFSDIAILADRGAVLQKVARRLRRYKIPHQRYKDDSLFTSPESVHWLIVLRAVLLAEISELNGDKIRAALATVFFSYSLADLSALNFADAAWREPLALLRQWRDYREQHAGNPAKLLALLNQIIDGSGVEKRLLIQGEYGRLARLRQIADYLAAEMLARRPLRDLAVELELLHTQKRGLTDDNNRAVAIDADQKLVRLMTIHAAKGLEFPVVIIAGGGKKRYAAHGVFQAILPDAQIAISDHKDAELPDNDRGGTIGERDKTQKLAESERLFYVALTRAQFLLLVPRTENLTKNDSAACLFLNPALAAANEKYPQLFAVVAETPRENFPRLAADSAENPEARAARELAENEIIRRETRFAECAFEFGKRRPSPPDSFSSLNTRGFHDPTAIRVSPADDEQEADNESENLSALRGGRETGNAIHYLLENLDFTAIADFADAETLLRANLSLFTRALKPLWQTVPLLVADRGKNAILRAASELVFNTLNAKIPFADNSGENFCLTEIAASNRRAELAFQFNYHYDQDKNWRCGGGAPALGKTLLGFIDLVAKISGRDGNDRWIIIDWKTNALADFSAENLAREMRAANYLLQRALYARATHEWLATLPISYQYEKNFGGVYYAFARGCRAGTADGWLAWKPQSVSAIDREINRLLKMQITG